MSRSPSSCIGLLLLAFAGSPAAAAPSAPPPDPCLRLETRLGALLIRLDRAAAPKAVATLEKLARGPIYDLDVVPNPEPARAAGYFDGLAFDYTRPHIETRLEVRKPEEAFQVEAELDAAALGLDREKVADAGEAMNLLQFELLPALKRPRAERRSTTTLEEWAARFEKDYDPSFLVGKSRREVLEAIGYRFQEGLASKPTKKGMVALVQASPTRAKLALSILLTDVPIRSGRWVVVGEVVEGLAVAEAIAVEPHATPQAKDNRPLQPVVVSRSELTPSCGSDPQGGTP